MSYVNAQNWIQLENAPQSIRYGAAISLNDNELIIATSKDSQSKQYGFTAGIYVYKQYHKKWKLLVSYPRKKVNGMNGHGITFDAKSDKLYLYNDRAQMIIAGMKSHEFDIIKTSVKGGSLPCLVNANGTIHVIGGRNNSKHLIWQHNSKTLSQIYSLNDNFKGAALLFVESKQILLLIGDTNIYTYSLQSNIWNSVRNISFDLFYPHAILTSDEKYVIIFGDLTNEIYLLDIRKNNQWKLKKSSVTCPIIGTKHVVKIGGGLMDQMLISGYCKDVINKRNEDIPMDIINLILQWYGPDKIHCIEYNDGISGNKHFVIASYDIIASVIPVERI